MSLYIKGNVSMQKNYRGNEGNLMSKTSMRSLVLCFAISLFLSSTAYAGDLTWTGCGISKKAFMTEMSKAYEQKTGTKVILSGGGATKGIRATAAGESDMGGACRDKILSPEENAAIMTPVAWDALVIIVNQDNPVSSITKAQVKDVFLGKISNWKALGGSDTAINLYVRKGKISGVGYTFRELAFDNRKIDFSSSALVQKSSGPIEKGIEKDLQGIGVSGVSSAKKRSGLKFLKVDNVEPSKANLMTATYPYYRPLYIVTKGEPQGEALKFINYALSAEGQQIISNQGTVNLKEGKELQSIFELEGMM
jgi:phosphate transport system substrate-binding protein